VKGALRMCNNDAWNAGFMLFRIKSHCREVPHMLEMDDAAIGLRHPASLLSLG